MAAIRIIFKFLKCQLIHVRINMIFCFSVRKKNNMSQLKDVREIITVKLPSFPDDEIVIYKGLLTYQVNDISKVETDYGKGLEILKTMIKSWTFVDEKDVLLTVNDTSIGMLPAKDFAVLMNHVNDEFETLDIKKKKS